MKRKRQKEDNEEADKIYETFLMEFGTDDHEDITFVHGGSVQPKIFKLAIRYCARRERTE